MALNRPLSCNLIGLGTNNRIYINHHLSYDLLLVKDKAMDLRREKIMDKVAPRYNLVKINIGGKWFKINNLQQLKNIIWKEKKINVEDSIPQQMDH